MLFKTYHQVLSSKSNEKKDDDDVIITVGLDSDTLSSQTQTRTENNPQNPPKEVPAKTAQAAAASKVPKAPKQNYCGDHLSCDPCFKSGCAWCIGERVCVEDAKWACAGISGLSGLLGSFG